MHITYKIYQTSVQHFCKPFLLGKLQQKALLLAGILCLFGEFASAAETRCGWLENPSPANWWLTDADGSWTLSTQGGEQLDDTSWGNMPKANSDEYVATNGSYGYSCVCLKVSVDKTQHRILQVHSGKQLLLKKCLEDPSLPSVVK